jgi:hypothetical protein
VTGIDLQHGRGIPELVKFQEYFKDFRIVVFGGLNCADVKFDGQTESEKRINSLYDDSTRHFHVITSLTGAMAKMYVCKGCSKGCKSDVTHKCEQACSDCMSTPPCAFSGVRIPCESCNRNYKKACTYKHLLHFVIKNHHGQQTRFY